MMCRFSRYLSRYREAAPPIGQAKIMNNPKRKHRTTRTTRRAGGVTVLTAFMLVGLFAFLSFSIDLGMIMVAKSELQNAADAAAIAGAWELIDENALYGATAESILEDLATGEAQSYAALNTVLTRSIEASPGNITVGFIEDPTDRTSPFLVGSGNPANAVRVNLNCNASENNPIQLAFARILGIQQVDIEASATAAILRGVSGVATPSNGGNIGILPFALDENSWNEALANATDDVWEWDELAGEIVCGSDGLFEANLFPQGTGSPGNRGTVDIGSSNNSTNDIARQILYGLTPDDLDYHDGKLEFDDDGKMYLNGDTGISAGVKDELESIKGQTRVIPLFTEVNGPGNNAVYTIVRLVGVRILDVKLTGKMSGKRLIVQPANVVVNGGIRGTSTTTSEYVSTPAWLIR
jgi:Flp pilus assembly protein TadG